MYEKRNDTSIIVIVLEEGMLWWQVITYHLFHESHIFFCYSTSFI